MVGALGVEKGKPSNLALFAPYLPSAQGTKKKESQSARRTFRSRRHSILKFSPRKTRSDTVDQTKTRATGDDDIWLTAESEAEPEGTAAQIRRRGAGSKTARKLVWPSQRRGKDDLESSTGVPLRPSIELKMTVPISRVIAQEPSRSTGIADMLTRITRPSRAEEEDDSDVSPTSEIPPSTMTGTEASFQLYHDTSDDTVVPTSALPAGFAQSFQGPVKVDRYLPRKGSLAFASSPPGSPKRKPVLGETTGNENTLGHKSRELRRRSCEGCALMKDELEQLREEVARLRRLVKGKGRAGV